MLFAGRYRRGKRGGETTYFKNSRLALCSLTIRPPRQLSFPRLISSAVKIIAVAKTFHRGLRPHPAKMVQSSVLGFPRMGPLRELKKATEAYWGGKLSREDLLAEGKKLRLAHWKLQKDAGVDIIPSNDFAFYDQVLDHIQLFNVRRTSP